MARFAPDGHTFSRGPRAGRLNEGAQKLRVEALSLLKSHRPFAFAAILEVGHHQADVCGFDDGPLAQAQGLLDLLDRLFAGSFDLDEAAEVRELVELDLAATQLPRLPLFLEGEDLGEAEL